MVAVEVLNYYLKLHIRKYRGQQFMSSKTWTFGPKVQRRTKENEPSRVHQRNHHSSLLQPLASALGLKEAEHNEIVAFLTAAISHTASACHGSCSVATNLPSSLVCDFMRSNWNLKHT
jgi:hypothetical protein